MANGDRSKSFKLGDLVFAKVRGYTPWPAQITHNVNSKKEYTVYFYGTGEIGYIKLKNLLPYSQNKRHFSTRRNMRRAHYAKALDEIKGALKGQNWQTMDVSSSNHFTEYDYDIQAPSATGNSPNQERSRPSNNEENEIVLANAPTAEDSHMDISYGKPEILEKVAVEQSGERAANAMPPGRIIVEPSPNATETQGHEIAGFKESDFIELCEEICKCLGPRRTHF
ncbi:hepatoma-derived growth factor-like [Drosophila obscura]|uniref:hepatoma-derived growth factor-like n=1 Tax=Drosophila obscura TaxID=7282 RepID=UPI001BB0D88B|nr:hepatoma-derived growth factor-like [Drosophila obscura]